MRPREGNRVRRITVSVPEANAVRLEEIAALEQGSLSQIVRRAIDQYLRQSPLETEPRLALRRSGKGG